MTLDSSGNLLVGTTVSTLSNTSTETGLAFLPNGASAISRSGLPALYLNRLTSDGDIMQFRKDGTTVGSIGTEVTDATLQADLYVHARSTAGGSSLNESRLWLLGGDNGIVLDGYTNAILPTDENSYEDNRTNLGSDAYRFKDLYLSGGVYLGGTGAANKLDDYEEGTWTPADNSNITINSIENATYTKVGRVVTVNAWIKANITSATFILILVGYRLLLKILVVERLLV
jgi:hypothetical protein